MALSDHLAIMLYVGAARADASPEQLDSLRSRVLPAMEDRHAVPYDEVRGMVRDIMGADWQPTGEWASQLAALDGDGLRGPQHPRPRSDRRRPPLESDVRGVHVR